MQDFMFIFNKLIEYGFDAYPATFIASTICGIFYFLLPFAFWWSIFTIIKITRPRKYYVVWLNFHEFITLSGHFNKFIKKRLERKYKRKVTSVQVFDNESLMYLSLYERTLANINYKEIIYEEEQIKF